MLSQNLYVAAIRVSMCLLLSSFATKLIAQPGVISYRYFGSSNDRINDIYQCEDGTYICGGWSFEQRNPSRLWLLRFGDNYELQWESERDAFGDNLLDVCWSLIETDNQDILLGGTSGVRNTYCFMASLVDGVNGRAIWEQRYSLEYLGCCRSVIECKSGQFLLGGYINIDQQLHGYALLIDEDGDVEIEAIYEPEVIHEINVIREVEGNGFYFGGENDTRTAPFVHVNNNLEIIDSWTFPFNDQSTQITGLQSFENDFLLGLNVGRPPNISPRVLRVSRQGDVRWDSVLDIENWGGNFCLTRMNDGTIALGGQWSNQYPGIVLIDRNGNLLWALHPEIPPNIGMWGLIYGGITTRASQFMFVGINGNPRNDGTGIVMTIGYESQVPEIVFITPPPPDLTMLTNERKRFAVRAEDHQGDAISFQYRIDGEVVADSFAYFPSWPDPGEHDVICTVSDGTYADSVYWHVTVTDLYISAFTPDTLNLTLRRGSSVDFSIDTVRYIEGAEPEYLWAVTNLDNPGEPEFGGSETAATITFNQSGSYSVEGLAYRGESSDAVTWNVTVRGAIWAFVPEELAFEVLPDSIVTFTVEPTVPDAEGQTIRWLVDGEVVAEDTTLLQWSFGSVDNFPRYLAQVHVVVADTVESDTVSWEVTVREPDAVGDKRDAYPTRMELLSVSPNPFNSMLSIWYDVGARHAVPLQIAIYDISGRMVAVIPAVTSPQVTDKRNATTRRGAAAENTVVWDASSIPAGVYFIRLQSGREIATKKVVLMK